jgi:hypothetical protein
MGTGAEQKLMTRSLFREISHTHAGPYALGSIKYALILSKHTGKDTNVSRSVQDEIAVHAGTCNGASSSATWQPPFEEPQVCAMAS